MEIFRTIDAMQAWSGTERAAGHSIGFVPTLGALHEGHLQLIRMARNKTDRVVVSVFLNPTQFDKTDDLAKYPVSLEADLKYCEQEKVAAVFLPTTETMYPDGPTIELKAPPLVNRLCGAARPGHFDGVVTIVKKLFTAVRPTHAVFGEKDFQQLAIIRWLVATQNLPIEIIAHPIVREADGLAMSSRNQRLSAEERKQALALSRSIKAVQTLFDGGERETMNLLAVAKDVLQAEPGLKPSLKPNLKPNLKIDYAEIVDTQSLESLTHIDTTALYAIAAFIGEVRLIDNCILSP